jgi:hypothetical protein
MAAGTLASSEIPVGNTFQIYRLEGAFAGIAGRVVLVQNQVIGSNPPTKKVYVWRWADEPGDPFELGKPLEEHPQIEAMLIPRYEDMIHGKLENLHHARYVALRAQTGDAFRAHVKKGPGMAWACLVAVLLCAPLLLPGVYFTASIYVIAAVLAVYVAALMDNSPYLMTATRVATAVSVGTVLLAVLAWRNAYSTSDQIAAAFRVAVVIPVVFGVVSTAQWIGTVATPQRIMSAG